MLCEQKIHAKCLLVLTLTSHSAAIVELPASTSAASHRLKAATASAVRESLSPIVEVIAPSKV